MTWLPISESDICALIDDSYARMSHEQKKYWEIIKVAPRKWVQSPWGDEGGGFWVVAIIGKYVIWFNDIEYGFNRSEYSNIGVIDGYFCNQDELEWQVQNVINQIHRGSDGAIYAGPPKPIV